MMNGYLRGFLAVILMLGSVQMTNATQLVLDETPLDQGQEGNITLDVYSEEAALGPEISPILLKEGKITYPSPKEWYIENISGKQTASPVKVDRNKWDLYFISIPFTIHATPANRYYKKVTFHMALDDESVTALDLYPKDINFKEEMEKVMGFSPEGKFKGVDLKLGSYTTTVKFTRLRPAISAFGEGESSFYWIYSSFQGEGVVPGTKHALIILKVPHSKREVRGELYYETVMEKERLGKWLPNEAKTAKAPFVLKLK